MFGVKVWRWSCDEETGWFTGSNRRRRLLFHVVSNLTPLTVLFCFVFYHNWCADSEPEPCRAARHPIGRRVGKVFPCTGGKERKSVSCRNSCFPALNPVQSHMMHMIRQSAAVLQHAARFGPTLAQRCGKGGPGERRRPSTKAGGQRCRGSHDSEETL